MYSRVYFGSVAHHAFAAPAFIKTISPSATTLKIRLVTAFAVVQYDLELT